MERYSGKSVMKGIAAGRLAFFKKQEYIPRQETVQDTGAEVQRFYVARQKAMQNLEQLYEQALASVGEEHAMIFDIHKMMLEDEDYLDSVARMISEESLNAEYAVTATGENFAAVFAAMDDEYMQARAADVTDVSARVVRILAGIGDDGIQAEEPVILVAEDLTPSETVKLDKSKILAFVTVKGSTISHTAILARSMNIPALVNTDMIPDESMNGRMAVVDGFTGEFLVDPEEDVLAAKIEAKNQWIAGQEAMKALIGKENVTTDGRKVKLYANVGSVSDVEKAIQADAGGIGLFRSEFLYLGRKDYPTEEEQFASYKQAAEMMGGKKVIIRTLDIGADKQADYFKLEPEENPAMGYRAIRICLDRTEVFKTQLRAIYRASAYGCIAVMFPMIISKEEVVAAKKIAEAVKTDLKQEGIAFGDVELGIMIETPAAALISDELAAEVDFFSIGTNDLTQYTLAVDRQNQQLEPIYAPYHKALLKLIKLTIENAHKAGIWAGICGELAGDIDMVPVFMDMGVDELSVSPANILPLRKCIREL